MSKKGQPAIGEVVIYVDPRGVEHEALVTNSFGNPHVPEETGSVNLVCVTHDENMTDQYGRQLFRQSSCPPERFQTAQGNYWKHKGE